MKPTTSTILGALGTALGGLASTGYTNASAVEDVYEGFIWWRVIEIARSLGWTLHLQNLHAGTLLLRCGPGKIYSPRPFTYARLTRGGHETLEVHLGIAIEGRSGVSHEFDVVVLTEAGADAARARLKDPSWRDVRVHVECKVFQGSLALGLGRAMWGLSADCRLRLKGGIATNASETPTISVLLRKHGNFYKHDVVPGSAQLAALDADLRNRLIRWT